jgi:hypothetical protein
VPDTPDFEQIARRVVDAVDSHVHDSVIPIKSDPVRETVVRQVAEQLRQVWNARGAADIARLETELSSLMGVTAAGQYVKNLDRALRTLDR